MKQGPRGVYKMLNIMRWQSGEELHSRHCESKLPVSVSQDDVGLGTMEQKVMQGMLHCLAAARQQTH